MTFHHEIFRESDKTLLADVECVRLVMDLNSQKLLEITKFFLEFV